MMGRMPPSRGRYFAVAVFLFVLSLSPYAHAAEATALGGNDSFPDAIQLWSAVLPALDDFAHRVALALEPYQAPTQLLTAPEQSGPSASASQNPASATQPAAAATSAFAVVESAISQFAQAPKDATAQTLGHIASALADLAHLNHLFGNTRTAQPASAVLPIETTIASQPQATSIAPQSPQPAATASAPTTIINHYITERIVQSSPLAATSASALPAQAGFITQDQFNAGMSALGTSLRQLINANTFNSAVSPPLGGGGSNTIAAASNIGQLFGTTLNNVTVTDVSGLTAGDIPTDITAANYLPLAGGTLTGDLTGTDLTLTGNLTVSGAQTLSGAITVPYVTATSTQTDSSFVRLTATTATTTNLVATNATSTNLFATLADFTTGIINTLSGTTLTYISASTTNISASGEAYLATASTTNLTATNATTSSLFVKSAFSSPNATIGALTATSSLAVFGSASFGATATSTFSTAGALTLSTPLAVPSGGTGATSLSGLLQGNGTSPITAVTGTAGQFPYFNGTNTLIATSSVFLASSGNVGIGTTSPTDALEIQGNYILGGGGTSVLTLSNSTGFYPTKTHLGSNYNGAYIFQNGKYNG
jgi:hypothetical protein